MKKKWNRELQNSLDRDCMAYFCERPVFDRLLRGFREKYESYGSFSGTVSLRNLTLDDIENLEGFFQKNFHGQKSVSISASRFEKALKNSRFGEIGPKDLLELYFQEEMTGKKEQKQKEAERWRQALDEIRQFYENTPAEKWIGEFSSDSKITFKELGNTIEEKIKNMHLAAKILNALPYRQNKCEYLAVFAAVITDNPHAFDEGTREGKILYKMALWDVKKRGMEIVRSEIFPFMQKQQLYFSVGILRDDISNYAMVSGMNVRKKDGSLHAGMDGFCQEGDMVQVPLNVIASWERAECADNVMDIVENPSVFAVLCGKEKEKNTRRAYMCMNGQPRLAGLMVLELLAKSGTKVYYAGDLDPEGILIAQKLSRYYKGEFHYWHMETEDYEKCKSEEVISPKRMKILERITDDRLKPVVERIKAYGTAGYQEMLMEETK